MLLHSCISRRLSKTNQTQHTDNQTKGNTMKTKQQKPKVSKETLQKREASALFRKIYKYENNLTEAITEYIKEGLCLPPEYITEYNELLTDSKNRK